MTKTTQGQRVFAALKRRPLTYAGMLALHCGNSPWKRCIEHIRNHAPDWTVKREVNKRDGLVRWRAVRAG